MGLAQEMVWVKLLLCSDMWGFGNVVVQFDSLTEFACGRFSEFQGVVVKKWQNFEFGENLRIGVICWCCCFRRKRREMREFAYQIFYLLSGMKRRLSLKPWYTLHVGVGGKWGVEWKWERETREGGKDEGVKWVFLVLNNSRVWDKCISV
jgi:hypothetical protein